MEAGIFGLSVVINSMFTLKFGIIIILSSFFTRVYGSPQAKNWVELWRNLNDIACIVRGPWVVAGDFNSILYKDENSGGSTQSSRCKRFRVWIRDCEMEDMGFTGSLFTWKRGLIQERLDRFVYNGDWKGSVKKASVYHLPRIQSDHCPIMLSYDNLSRGLSQQRPFRFLATWESHENWNNFVQKYWNNDIDFVEALANFSKKVKEWNVSMFGNIHSRKARVLARIGGLQKALETHSTTNLRWLEIELKKEYATILLQ